MAAQGTPEVMASTDPLVHQFVNALPVGPVPFHYPQGLMPPRTLALPQGHDDELVHPANLGFAVRSKLADIGRGARLFARLMQLVGAAFARPGLVRDQVHFLGNYSLAIIAVSGLFVGFVLGLQGYYTLQRRIFGGAGPFGGAVAGARAGPGGHGFVVRGRAGTSLTAEIGLMRAGEQPSAMEMMAVIRCAASWPPVLGRCHHHALLAAVFSAVGVIGGWVVGVLMIGIDPGAFWARCRAVDVWKDVGNGVLKSLVFGFTVTFIALCRVLRPAHARGFPRHHAHGGHGLAGRAGVGLRPHGSDVQYLTPLPTGGRITAALQNDVWVGLFVLLGRGAGVLALQSANLR